MANGVQVIQKTAIKQLRAEASRLKKDFREYLEDLEMFSNPEFWEAIEELKAGKTKKFSSVKKMLAELDK